jgi:methyltransferase (TIGR00027 family)
MDAGSVASRSAVLVCQGRAAGDGVLAAGRFDDPVAMAMLGEDERGVVEQVRAGTPPQGWGNRMAYELVRACAEGVVPRTVAIDDAVIDSAAPQLVILGAGLDGRAWRLSQLATVRVFEVDHPASQADKLERVGTLAPIAKSLRLVRVDFARGGLGAGLAAAGHDPAIRTTWIWEGVVPYLTREQVQATVGEVAQRSAAGSRLIVNYQAPSVVATIGRLVVRVMNRLGRRADPLAGEPNRSTWTPATMRDLLAAHGFIAGTDQDLLSIASDLSMTVTRRRSLRNGRVVVADR